MKHEPSPRRDQREIVVPGDMRPNRAAVRSPARSPAASVPPGEMRAAFGAGLAWIGRTCLARPGEAAGFVIALGAVAYVSANALGFQVGRHPAPILPKPVSTLARTEVTAAKPVETKPATESAAVQRSEPKPSEKPLAHDAIGDILREAGDATGSTAPVMPKPDRSVMQAQHALAKLGYAALKPDGMMGPATRAAIERFERERKLPVTGEATGRTLRELATRARPEKG